eukprot:RCo006693
MWAQVLLALAILAGLAVVLKFLRGRKARQAVLLLGLPNSGKTAFWFKVMTSQDVVTHTSMKENKGYLPKPATHAHLRGSAPLVVDVPGHMRCRPLVRQYLSAAKAIVFLVDSIEIIYNYSSVAEYLYSLLTNADLVRRGLPVMIACNKRDDPLSAKPSLIQEKLEKELTTLRSTKKNELLELGDSQEANAARVVPLGSPQVPFTFTQSPLPVLWRECSVATGDQLEDLMCFMWTTSG